VLLYNVKNETDFHLANDFYLLINKQTCNALGYSLYCVGISMFCWMSVMCFDLFWTFGRATIPRYGKIETFKENIAEQRKNPLIL
jgi:hypothetical protein